MSAKSLKVKLRPSKFFTRAECVCCGEEFSLGSVRASLWDEQERIGNICYECLQKGPEAFSALLKDHVKRLRREADDLERLTKRPFECPSWETFKELEKLADNFEKQFHGSEDYEDAYIQLEQRFKDILKEKK